MRQGRVLWDLLFQFITAEILQPICPIKGNKTFLSTVSLLPCDGHRRSPLLELLSEAPPAGRGGGDGVGFGATPRGEAERPAAHASSQADSSSQKCTGTRIAPSAAGADHGCGTERSKANVSTRVLQTLTKRAFLNCSNQMETLRNLLQN